ncbi:TPA: restriction endonuclease subunit S [Vibrio parahaemolyticus]|uniref:restriction endonuclease subunit S n=1 Tax=Vibrio parahaemolyticus TaxID=670 RepID=UPI0013024219|nr:restriction endonuclease subunit S [Vibrio parahaemolyticus]HAS6881996.1 restriction endonuclease subunit S [Vibrio parahaemolyticus]
MAGRYKAYSEYKDSGVDWLHDIPSHWKTIPVGRCYHRVKRTGYESEELLSVYRDHGVIPKSSRDDNNNKASDDLSPYQLVCENNLVMNKMKAWQGSIAISEHRGIVSPAYFVYEPFKNTESIVYPKYVHYLLRHPIYITQYMSRSKGIRVNQWDLDPESFQSIELLLPRKEEQQKIIRFLDHETAKIDTLIAKQEILIELLREKRQAVISHAVTKGLNPDAPMKDSGVDWLGEVPEHWSVKGFNHCAKIRGGLVDPKLEQYKDLVLYAPNHIEKETGKVIYKESADAQGADSNKYLCFKGEVIYSKIRPALAKVALCDEEVALCSADMYPIDAYNGLTNTFLYWFLLSDSFTKAVVLDSDRVAMPKVNRESLGEYRVPVPPLDEQLEICNSIKYQSRILDELEEKASYQIALMKERKTALISAAVTGKIDVRDWVGDC